MALEQQIKDKFGSLPAGFYLEVIAHGPHFIGGPVYIVTLTGFYNGQQHTACDVLHPKNSSYISALRDNLKHTHWRNINGLVWENESEKLTLMETFGYVPRY